jgi:hypothetical protein
MWKLLAPGVGHWMHKLKKLKTNSFAIVYFFFDDRLFD